MQISASVRNAKNTANVKINSFILTAEPLEGIESGTFGASSFHREMLQVSKLDKIAIAIAQIKDMNPLGEISVLIDFKILKTDHKDIQFDEN